MKDIIHIGCWAHARRKFYDVIESLKSTKYDKKESLADKIMDLISELYDIERFGKENNFSREELRNYRQEKSKPILYEIKETTCRKPK